MIESQNIKSWAEDDRPREKMLLKGKKNLSDAELLAIIIGSGSRNETAVDLAKRMLKSTNNNWNALAKLSIKELSKFKGIGEAKAISIVATLEVGQRRALQETQEKLVITSSEDVYNLMIGDLADIPHEEFWVLLLNRANKVIHTNQMSIGGIHETVVDIRLILKNALEHLAVGIILVHNHPSGNTQPSEQDKIITQKLNNAAVLLEIKLLDHVIVSEKKYFSFADEGIL
ncbi:MAG: DNA repair protein RadC [Solirubrobacteraceae bacterium]